MDAFSFPSLEDLRPNPLDTYEIGDSQNAFKKATGGGIAVSRSTVLSQVLGETENKPSSQNEDQMLSPHEPSTEDLAAKWQAALAADDLLDDDELLDEDSLPQSSAVDPAALFGSDDEGFLDDDDEPTLDQYSAQQQISPPMPAPVVGSDERTIGFDSMTSGAFPQQNNSNRYLPPNTTQSPVQQSNNVFAPHAPLFY